MIARTVFIVSALSAITKDSSAIRLRSSSAAATSTGPVGHANLQTELTAVMADGNPMDPANNRDVAIGIAPEVSAEGTDIVNPTTSTAVTTPRRARREESTVLTAQRKKQLFVACVFVGAVIVFFQFILPLFNGGCDDCAVPPATDNTNQLPGPFNAQCQDWTAGDVEDYTYNSADWAPLVRPDPSSPMVLGDSSDTEGLKRAAKTLACVGVAQLTKHAKDFTQDMWKQCPIWIGTSYNEAKLHTLAQGYDGIGRGPWQFGGPAAPACSRGDGGVDSGVAFTGDASKPFNFNSGSLVAATPNEALAYNPVWAFQTLMTMTNNGKHWLPKGAAWWSCDTNTLKVKEWEASRELAMNACMQVTGLPRSFFASAENGNCAVGEQPVAWAQISDICNNCHADGSVQPNGQTSLENKEGYCRGEQWTNGRPAMPTYSVMPTPTSAPAPATNPPSAANAPTATNTETSTSAPTSSSDANAPFVGTDDLCKAQFGAGFTAFASTPQVLRKTPANTPMFTGVFSCGKAAAGSSAWQVANSGQHVLDSGRTYKNADCEASFPGEGFSAFDNTPFKGVTSCGLNWGDANRRCKIEESFSGCLVLGQ